DGFGKGKPQPEELEQGASEQRAYSFGKGKFGKQRPDSEQVAQFPKAFKGKFALDEESSRPALIGKGKGGKLDSEDAPGVPAAFAGRGKAAGKGKANFSEQDEYPEDGASDGWHSSEAKDGGLGESAFKELQSKAGMPTPPFGGQAPSSMPAPNAVAEAAMSALQKAGWKPGSQGLPKPITQFSEEKQEEWTDKRWDSQEDWNDWKDWKQSYDKKAEWKWKEWRYDEWEEREEEEDWKAPNPPKALPSKPKALPKPSTPAPKPRPPSQPPPPDMLGKVKGGFMAPKPKAPQPPPRRVEVQEYEEEEEWDTQVDSWNGDRSGGQWQAHRYEDDDDGRWESWNDWKDWKGSWKEKVWKRENDDWREWKGKSDKNWKDWEGEGEWGYEEEEEEVEIEVEEEMPKSKRKKRKKKHQEDAGRWEWQEDEGPERWGESWEQPREETGLQLIGELAPSNTMWDYILLDESRRSFAGYLPCHGLFFRGRNAYAPVVCMATSF
ncbi:unnamed protein product, partial [Effrenium voratum]